jgi:hypothetical protein
MQKRLHERLISGIFLNPFSGRFLYGAQCGQWRDIMDRVKRNAEIVALVKARKMPMRRIAERYRLDVSTIYSIANEHGVHLRAPDPQKVRIASELINCGMPLTHVAQRAGFNIQTLRRILEAEGLYVRSPPPPLWTEAEVRVLRWDMASPDFPCEPSQLSLAARQTRSCVRPLGLKWPLKFRANLGSEPALTDLQKADARRRLAAGESA